MRRNSKRHAGPSFQPRGVALLLTLLALHPASAASQSSAKPLFSWQETLYGNEEGKLRWPIAIAVAADDEFAVADAYESRLLLFIDRGGGVGWKQEAVVELPAAPAAIVFDGERYVLSLRQAGSLLVAERPQMRFREIGLAANIVPGALAVTAKKTYLVFDLAGNSILITDAAGDVELSLPVDGFVTSLAGGAGTDFYAAIADPGEIRRYSAVGELLDRWPVPTFGPSVAWPVGVETRTGGEVVIADRRSHRLLVLETSGRLAGTGSRWGWEPGLLKQPSDLALFPNGRVIVADQGNGRVQIFRPIQ